MHLARSTRRARLAAVLSTALAVAGLQLFAAPTAQSNPAGTGLVISEVYGGGGNSGASRTHDFIELYNPTGAAISVAGWSVQYRSATGTSATLTNLTGSVPAGGHYLIQEASSAAVGAAMPTPNASGAITMSGANGVVILANDTTPVTAQGNFATGSVPTPPANVVDTVGYGTTPTTFEATNTAVALTNTTSAQRAGNGADTDANNPDFSEGVPTPTNAAGETGPAGVTVAEVTNKTGTVGTPITGFTASATGGATPYSWSDNATLPPGVSIDPTTGAVSGTPTIAGPYNVVLTVTDSTAPTALTDTEDFTFTISAAPVGVTPIADIQGSTGTSPLAGQTVTAQGVVTAKYPTGGFNGFYIQTPGADSTPGRSDAIFVFTPGFDDSTLAIGDSVEVTGGVSEFETITGGNTLTEITATAVTAVTPSLGTVVAKTVIPGTDCALPGTSCPSLAAADAAKEEVEGEAFQPAGSWTVTDAYDGSATNPSGSGSSSFFGEIGLAANSALPLISPTEIIDASATADIADRRAYNNAHRVVLDDGSSTTFWNTTNTAAGQNAPLPWFTQDHQVRVGAGVTFPTTVILENRFGWKVQPTTTVVGAPTAGQHPQFAQDRPAAPAAVGGDLKLATFNVLNYFTTLGANYTTGTPPVGCTAFNDRAGNPIAVNSCPGSGPRGAWNTANFLRQQAKIVNAINTMDADIVSLEEIENSRKVDATPNRDEAIANLVTALNTAAGSTRWAFVPSPGEANLPTVADEDVIRNGFIYDPSTVTPVGASRILVGSAPFANAREPLAQVFKAKGAPNADGFAVVVNHFKSKGCSGATGDNLDTGQGCFNGDRVLQAQALSTFATQFATDRGVIATFLTGDFNSYSEEDPVQALETAGWIKQDSTDDPAEESYSFDGSSGSLDHVFANAAGDAMVTGADIWEINANETVFNQYSRFNYVGTDLYNTGPFSASDHNPEIVGIDVPGIVTPTSIDVQILGTNDFHGRLLNDTTAPTSGAGVLAGAVKQLRSANPNTVFAAAGDLIGATTFESFIAKDKPTIDVLNEAGLEVSAAGNHEFDAGYDDLINRVMAPYDATTNPLGGAEWEYIAANVRKLDNSRALAPTWTQDFGSVRVGFVGAVTEHLPELVSPAGISQIQVTDIVQEVNASADDLEAAGADVIVMLVHEGAPGTACDPMDDDPTSDFGSIITGVNANVDAIVSGHTHLAYNCEFDVPAWAGRPVTKRPVVSAGQYGMALNQLIFTVDTTTGQVQAKSQAILSLKTGTSGSAFNYPVDPATQTIVDAAVADANTLGAQPLGQVAGPLRRATLVDGTTENRGAESVLGNLVAEVQRWATSTPTAGAAQIAFMNPGGLRADMLGTGATGDPYPRTLTYRQAANVQPFANTLVNMDLTGAQIKAVLEQQWQPGGAARPFLKLGISKGFAYTADPGAAQGSRVTGMWLDGTAISPTSTYSVTVNSFLASGGDNFTTFAPITGKQDTGQTDLQAMVDYMDEFANPTAGDPPLPVPTKQNGVGVTFAPGSPATYAAGDDVQFDVTGWSFTRAGDPLDASVVVTLDGTTLGTFPLDNAAQAALPGFDVTGKATVTVEVPPGLTAGPKNLVLTGATTGTEVKVPFSVTAEQTITADDVTITYGQQAQIEVSVSGNSGVATGTAEVFDGATSLGSAPLVAGVATITLAARSVDPGTRTLTAQYSGDSSYAAGSDTLQLVVDKAAATTTADDTSVAVGQDVVVPVTVTGGAGVTPGGTVEVYEGATLLGTATLSASGVASVPVDSSGLSVGTHDLTAKYLGSAFYLPDDADFVLTVGKATATLAVTAPPMTYGQESTVTVTVSATGAVPTGTVQVKNGGTVLGTGTVSAGVASITLPARSLPPGSTALTAVYSGNASVAERTAGFVQVVDKATATVRIEVEPDTIKAGRTKARVKVTVTAPGVVPVEGEVKIFVEDQGTETLTLVDGRAKLRLDIFKKAGKRTIKVKFLGSELVLVAKEDGSLKVV